MSNPLPTAFYPGFAVETVDTVVGIFIPLENLNGLTEAQASPTTGDGRAVFKALLHQAYAAIEAMPVASRPKNLTITIEDEPLAPSSPIHTLRYDVVIQATASPATYVINSEPS